MVVGVVAHRVSRLSRDRQRKNGGREGGRDAAAAVGPFASLLRVQDVWVVTLGLILSR